MNDGLLSAIASINKVNDSIAQAFESPAVRILRSQNELHKSLSPLSAIDKSPLFASQMGWMNAIVKPISTPSYLSAIQYGLTIGVFDQLKSLDNVSAIAKVVNKNYGLYDSLLNSVDKASPWMSATSGIGDLAVLSMVKPNAFMNIGSVQNPDLWMGSVFKNMLDMGIEENVEYFESIAEILTVDEVLKEDFVELFHEFATSIEKKTDALNENVDRLYEMLATEISERKKLSKDTVMAFLSLILAFYGTFIQNTHKHEEVSGMVEMPVASDNSTSSQEDVEYALIDVHLRKSASKNSKSLLVIKVGQGVRIIEKRSVWMRVEFVSENEESITGWVNIDMFSSQSLENIKKRK